MKSTQFQARRSWLRGGAAALAACVWPALAQDKPALQRIRERGTLVDRKSVV